MTEDYQAAEPARRRRRGISKIWLLPILTMIIGLGMVYQHWAGRGIQIQVRFDTAEGIVSGKTPVRYRDVDIGIVNSVDFSEQRDAIVVGIEIENSQRDFLRTDSLFWVVKPRIGAGGISGVSTLLSGSYISLAPGNSDETGTEFTALEQPPVTAPAVAGLHLTLTSTGDKPPAVGSPVIHRGFAVGRVESTSLDPSTREATYRIFIEAPYDALVTSNTFFWNAGGLSVQASAQGLRIDVATVEALISGGIAFDTPPDESRGDRVTESRRFELYDSWESILNRQEYAYFTYAILVEDSVSGLSEGAPVEYRGVRVGSVETPFLAFDEHVNERQTYGNRRIPVIVRIEPGRVVSATEVDLQQFDELLQNGIKNGMAATVESANLLTGSRKISLDFIGEPIAAIEKFGPYNLIPSKKAGVAGITEQLNNVLTKLDQLPLDQTLQGANQAIRSADSVLISLDDSLKEFNGTLKGIQPDSRLYDSLNNTMRELQATLIQLQPLVTTLANRPNSVIFGRSPVTQDVQPTAWGKQ